MTLAGRSGAAPAAAPAAAHPPARVAWWTVALLGALYIVSFVDRLVLSLLVEPIKAELGLSDAQMGLLLGASFAFFYALFGLPLSFVADRGNRRGLIVFGVLLWTVLTAVSGFASGFGVLLLCRLGVGLGEAVLQPAAVSLIGDLFPREKRALPLAVYLTAGAFGASGAFILAAAVLQSVADGWALPGGVVLAPWRATLVLVGLPGVLLGLLFALTVREPPRTGPPAAVAPLRDAQAHFREHLRTYLGLFGGIGLAGMVTFGTVAWYPTHLIRAYDETAQSAGYAFGAVAMIGAVSGSFVVPLLADRLLKAGRRDALVLTGLACIAVTALCYAAAFLAPTARSSLLWAGPAIFALSGLSQLAMLSIQLITPGRLRGMFTAGYLFWGNIAGLGLGPTVVAAAAGWFNGDDALGKGLTLVTLTVCPLVALFLLQARKAAARSLEEARLD